MAIETAGGLLSLLATFLIIFIVFALISYVYFALALMVTAKRLGVKNAWLAWIPVINIYLFPKMARKPVWPIVFIIVPYLLNLFINIDALPVLIYLLGAIAIVGIVFTISWLIKILKRRGKPWWWLLLFLIPIFNFIWVFVMWGILAWGKDKKDIKPNFTENYEPNEELIRYLRKYKSEGYTIEELKQHLINEGQNPQEIDSALKNI